MAPHSLIFLSFLAVSFRLPAQNNCNFQVVAGFSALGDGGPATSALLMDPHGISTDAAGNLYIADTQNHRIRRVAADHNITTVAGSGTPGSSGDGGTAVSASLLTPQAVLAAPDGSLYIADTGNHRIRRVAPDGSISAFAGTGHPGFSGDLGSALNAEFNGPTGMALDSSGTLYVADTNNNRVRRIDPSGIVTTIAGTGAVPLTPCCTKDDGGLATSAQLYAPLAVLVAPDGSVYIADTGNAAVRKVSPLGIITTVAGTIGQAVLRSTYPAPASQPLGNPSGLVLGPDGSLYIADSSLVQLTADGKTQLGFAVSGGTSLAADTQGGFYVTSPNTAPAESVYHIAGAGAASAIYAGSPHAGKGADGALASGPVLHTPAGMAVGPDNSLYAADYANGRIVKVANGVLRIVASAQGPVAVSVDQRGNLFVAEYGSGLLRKVAPDGTTTTLAGGGGTQPNPIADTSTMPATSVNFQSPYRLVGVAAHPNGNVFLAAFRIGISPSPGYLLMLTPEGKLQTIFATIPPGSSFASAYSGLSIDQAGDVLFPIQLGTILRFDGTGKGLASIPVSRTTPVTNIAGGPADSAYVTDSNGRIARIAADGSRITIYNRELDQFRPASQALSGIAGEMGVAVGSQGDLFVSDRDLQRIRELAAGGCNLVPQPPAPTVLSSASASVNPFGAQLFAPGLLVSLYGSGMGPATGIATAPSGGYYPFSAGGVRVLFEGVPAPILYSGAVQVNSIVPFTLYGRTAARMQVEVNGVLSDAVSLPVVTTAPGIFTYGDAKAPAQIVVNPDGSLNSSSNPAPAGSYVTVYMTGLGLTSPAGTDGHLAASPPPLPLLPLVPDATYSSGFSVLYSGDAPGLVEGVSQVNIQLPKQAISGQYPFHIGGNIFNLSVTSK